MIGTLVSVKFIGHKNWMQSIIFWAVALVVGIIATSLTSFLSFLVPAIGLIVGVAVVLGLLVYWYKFPLSKAIVIWAVALVIDIVIVLILAIILVAFVGTSWMAPLIPISQFIL